MNYIIKEGMIALSIGCPRPGDFPCPAPINAIKVSTLNSQNTSRSRLYIFLFFLCIYLFTNQGSIQSTDGKIMFYLTQSIVERGELSFTEQVFADSSSAKQFSKYGIGMSLLAIPFYLLGKILSAITGIAPYYSTQFCVGAANALITSLTVLYLYRFSRDRFDWSHPAALAVSLGFGLSTMGWAYAEDFMSEPATSLLILSAAYYLTDPEKKHRLRVGLLLGMAVSCRLASCVVIPGFLLYEWLSFQETGNKSKAALYSDLIRITVPILAFLILILLYNYVRYQNIFETGYEKGFDIEFLAGLSGILFSPGKSIFLYNPLVLAGCLAVPLFYKTSPKIFFLFAWITLSNLILFSLWHSWYGGLGWGPRLILVALPYLILPIGFLWERGQKNFKICIISLIALGILIQIPSVVVSPSRYYYQMRNDFQERGHDLLLHSPAYSPLIGQVEQVGQVFKNLSDTARLQDMAKRAHAKESFIGKSDQDILDHGLSVNAPNFWWYYMHLFGYPFYLTFLPAALLVFAAVFFGIRLFSGNRA